jgi:hypothetical protein
MSSGIKHIHILLLLVFQFGDSLRSNPFQETNMELCTGCNKIKNYVPLVVGSFVELYQAFVIK